MVGSPLLQDTGLDGTQRHGHFRKTTTKLSNMFKCLVNYNFTPDPKWIGDDYLIYDRSDDGIDHLTEFDQSKIIKTKNVGNVDYDKLTYLIDYYDSLPEVFLWGKTNLFKYITEDEYEKVKDNQTFTPLLTQNHHVYSDRLGNVCYYSGEMYHERNTSWYVAEMESRIKTYREFAQRFLLPSPYYLAFPPGGNSILTREKVHKYSADFYAELRSILPYTKLPAEAHMLERSYYTIWK